MHQKSADKCHIGSELSVEDVFSYPQLDNQQNASFDKFKKDFTIRIILISWWKRFVASFTLKLRDTVQQMACVGQATSGAGVFCRYSS